MGTMHNRSLCFEDELSVGAVCELESGPTSGGDGRISLSMAGRKSVCISTILPSGSLSIPDSEAKSYTSADRSGVERSTMVCSVTDNGHRAANIDSSESRHVTIADGSESPATGDGQSTTRSMADLRRRCETAGVSEQALALISHSWRGGTRAVYDSAWKAWCSWCSERENDPLHAPVAAVLDYLTELLHRGLAYRTIGVHRSAISAFHVEVEGKPVGQHPLVEKLLTGVFNANPPKPRYSSTWDVNLVLNFISSLGQNSALSDQMLSRKLAMLIALVTGSRASESHALNLEWLEDKDNVFTFTIPTLTKTRKRGSNAAPMLLSLEEFSEPLLDPRRCLKSYIARTAAWRTTATKHQLFLATIGDHHPVVTSTISSWMVKLMQAAGVDTGIFKAHSTRSASTTKAATHGVPIQEIISRANWTNAGTFKTFYYRPEVKPSDGFAEKVLSNRSVSFEQAILILTKGFCNKILNLMRARSAR